MPPPRYRLRQLLADLRAPTLSPRATVFLETSRLIALLIFIATVASIVLISYVGVSTVNQPVMPGQIANIRLTASADFSYVSQEKTRQSRERLTDRIPPVYRLDQAPFQRFASDLTDLFAQLETYERQHPASAPSLSNRKQALAALVDAFNARGPYRLNVDDVTALLASGDATLRARYLEHGLVVLHDIYLAGVQDPTIAANSEPGSVIVFQIATADGEIVQRPVQTLEEAQIFLRISLTAEDISRELSLTLFRLFRAGLTPNLVFSREATHLREVEAAKTIAPVTIRVDRGQTIIEPGTRVTPEQYEMLTAYRTYLDEHGTAAYEQNMLLASRILLVLAMVLACIVYIRIEDAETLQSNGRLALLSMVVILNLALVRATYALLDIDFFEANSDWASTLPYFAPTALAPLIIAILIDAGSAIFVALLISFFTGIIYGNRIDVQVITVLASVVAVHGCRTIHQRSNVVRAATTGGLMVTIFALLVGLLDGTSMPTLIKQMGAGLLTGMLTGMAVVGVLPVLESLFKRTTDITLLELTDYTHPFLRRLQLDAPGTYHHSLVVAQLTENAAAAIGANPLLARVCALFHDIGKSTRPDFFTENQRNGINPHDDLSPEESACILRGHVTEGIELARKYHMPKYVIDAIQQHHGTTLMRYFYQRATQRVSKSPIPGAPAPSVDDQPFRYDGPKPQGRELAILALADTVEAAVRSMKASTPEATSEIIEKLVQERIADGQMDAAALTFAELARIKASFQHTLGNMLHSRIAYPPATPAPATS